MLGNLMRLLQLPRLVGLATPSRGYSLDTKTMYDKLKFQFSEENKCRIKELLAAYPEKERRGALLPMLDLAQRQHGWLPITAIQAVAQELKLEPFAVWKVASFYDMFHLRPVGKYLVKVCMTTPCQLRCSAEIWETCVRVLDLKDKETSKDMQFTLKAVHCLGACVNGPVMSINDDLYEDLNVENVEQILDGLKNDKISPSGPQSGRFASEPVPGPTTLLIEPPKPGFGMQELCKPNKKPA